MSTKVCKKCNKEKSISEFNIAKRNNDGLENRCRTCKTSRALTLRQHDPEKYHIITRKQMLRKRYGITISDYDRMLQEQENKCAICKSDNVNRKTSRYFHVDHDHKTGKVRGLLCNQCNVKLAWFERYDILGYLEEDN